jgi:hypothetical protein
LKRIVVLRLASLSFAVLGAAQPSQHEKDSATAVRTRIYVFTWTARPLLRARSSSRTVSLRGSRYRRSGAWSFGAIEEDGLLITSPKPSIERSPKVSPFSSGFRRASRSRGRNRKPLYRGAKKDKAVTAPRFDQIDHELSLSTVHVQTDADMDVYYAQS